MLHPRLSSIQDSDEYPISNVDLLDDCGNDNLSITGDGIRRKRRRISVAEVDRSDVNSRDNTEINHHIKSALNRLKSSISARISAPHHMEKGKVIWEKSALSFQGKRKMHHPANKMLCTVSMPFTLGEDYDNIVQCQSVAGTDDDSSMQEEHASIISGPSSVYFRSTRELEDDSISLLATDSVRGDVSTSTNGVQDVKTCFLPLLLPNPRSQSWNNIPSNIRTEDEPVLRHVPYFGDDDVTGVDVSAYDQVPGELEHELSAEPDEIAILYMVDRHNIASESHDSSNSDTIHYGARKNLARNTRPEVITALERVLGISTSQLMKTYKRASEGKYYRDRLAADLQFLKNKYSAKDMPDSQESAKSKSTLHFLEGHPPVSYRNVDIPDSILGIKSGKDFSALVESYRELFCRRCYTYDCPNHGAMQPLPWKRVDPVPPFPCPIPGLGMPNDYHRIRNTLRRDKQVYDGMFGIQKYEGDDCLGTASTNAYQVSSTTSIDIANKSKSSTSKDSALSFKPDSFVDHFRGNGQYTENVEVKISTKIKAFDHQSSSCLASSTDILALPEKLYASKLINNSKPGKNKKAPPLTVTEKSFIDKCLKIWPGNDIENNRYCVHLNVSVNY